MSGPSFEEMEAKRQEMIASFKDIAAAMTRCVSIIEDYTRLSPSSLPTLNSFSGLPTLSAAELARAVSTIDATSIPVEKKKRNKAEKKAKDPNAPKRPPSAYILYQNEVRDALRSERPELAYKDILALISEKWKALPDAERKVFEGKYVDAQNQFKTLDDAYKSGAAVTKPAPAAAVGAVAADSSESSDDSDSSDEDDSLPASTPFQQQAYLATPQHSAAGAVAPSLLNSAQATLAATPDVKKEKKRKNKDVADVAATPLPAEDDKKKRKKKSKD